MLSQAMYHARELAMTRMEAEADALGADGIVGVRLDVEMKEFGADVAEFIAVGTAVKAEPGAGGGGVANWRNNKNQPFTSDLSGQDFWTLIRAGYAPLGMVMGTCVYHIAHQRIGVDDRQHRAERRDRAVHPGAVRRPRAGDVPDAGRGRGAARRGHRRRPAPPAQPHLGLAHDRVLRDRHGGPPAARRPRHRAPHDGACPWTPNLGRAGRSRAANAVGPLTMSSRRATRSRRLRAAARLPRASGASRAPRGRPPPR